jgi:hypothetical protein
MANNPRSQEQGNQERTRRENPEQQRHPGDKSEQHRERQPGQAQFAQGQPRENPRGDRGNEGLVGVDTDGDGKVVKPGQKPGQSHGRGLPEDKQAENRQGAGAKH